VHLGMSAKGPIADIEVLIIPINSSARPISVFGMLRPSAFAVLRLITNSVCLLNRYVHFTPESGHVRRN
jgi:hypothetical protein